MAFPDLFHLLRSKLSRSSNKSRTSAEKRRLNKALRRTARFPVQRNPAPHGLPGELIVSLTSYPPRFEVLPLTIKSLLDQSVHADRLILWVAHDDLALVPPSVRALEDQRFSVRPCDDLGSFKKILPTLAEHPASFIVTADDDTYYPPHWLAGLVRNYDAASLSLVCHRGHRLKHGTDGSLAPYLQWERDIADRQSRRPSSQLFPTGVGGVLYPPGSLPRQALDWELIRKLSPTCDDSWLFFMARSVGWKARRVPGRVRLITWPQSQKQALRRFNRDGRKDEMLAALCRHFGVP